MKKIRALYTKDHFECEILSEDEETYTLLMDKKWIGRYQDADKPFKLRKKMIAPNLYEIIEKDYEQLTLF